MMFARVSRGLRSALPCAVAGGVLGLCGPANAAMTLRLDVNSLTVQAGGAFDGETHTGVLTLRSDGDTSLQGLLIDGVSHAMNAGLGALSGSILLENGVVVGGVFDLTLSDNSTYSAVVGSGVGDVSRLQAQGFSVDGLTGAGLFGELADGKEFGGVDVTAWLEERGSLDGSFYLFAFGPGAGGVDTDVDLELYLTAVPAPGSVVLGATGVLFASRRKRRPG